MPAESVFHELFDLKPGKGDLQRFRILKAAVKCISHDGFEGGTFDKIAKRLGTRRSHVSYYYADRHVLFEQVIQFVIATAQSITVEMVKKAGASPGDQIVAICEAAFEWADRYPDQARVLLYFHFECASKARYRRLNTKIRESGVARLEVLIEEAMAASPRMRLRLPAGEAAKALQSMITGMVLDSLATVEARKGRFRAIARKACRDWIENAGHS